MPKKSTKQINKKPLKHHIKTYNFFLIFAALLGMFAGVLLVQAFYQEKHISRQPSVNLGSIQYDFSSGKAVKRDTPAIVSLRGFLTEKAAKDCTAIHSEDEPTNYQVVAANENVSQVLIGYGCGNTNARMFAVRTDNSWHFVSPTNQFDTLLFDVPNCSYAKKNKIDKSIAPVCYSVEAKDINYHVR